jgi:cell volume regulation protein A
MPATILIVLGGVIALGFLGSLLVERTRIPDVLVLMAAGILLGPVSGIVPPDAVRPFMPFFGTIALTMILLEGGIELDLAHAVRQGARALLLCFLSFGLTALVVYYAIFLGLSVSGSTALAAAAALACTSAPIVIPTVARLVPGSPLRPLLALESAFSDALAVILVLAVLDPHHAGRLMGPSVAGALGKSVLLGAAGGLLGGLVWLAALTRVSGHPFRYLMTVGFVFLLIGGIERLHGSGAISVLLFGMVLANGGRLIAHFRRTLREEVAEHFRLSDLPLHPEIAQSHAEASFMVRSFFFVYLGVIFRWPGADARMWLTVLLVSVAVVVARELAVQVTAWMTRIAARDRAVLTAMMPRGLATAVLAAMLMTRAPQDQPSWETLAAFIVIVTNVWMTFRIVKIRHSPAAGPSGPP